MIILKTTAIICEYNPFTNGHKKHLELARKETGADTIACVMSGSFTQRGDACVADKYQRAEIAIRMGADIVVELPLIYAISPSDNFALGAIKIISQLPDVEYLSFGSECGDLDKLTRLAALLIDEPTELSIKLQACLKEGYSFPRARAEALEFYLTENNILDLKDLINSPNNVLALSYIIAVKKLNLNIKFHTIKRETDYNSIDLTENLPSASAVRNAMRRGELYSIKHAVPIFTYNLLESYHQNITSLGDMILYKVKTTNGFEINKLYDVTGGLENRFKFAGLEAKTYEELLEKIKTKAYTMARIKRICLYLLFDITDEFYRECLNMPTYVFVLALNKDRKDILSALNSTAKNLLVRFADRDKVDKSLRKMIKLDFTAQGVLGIINKSNYYNKKVLLI